ncbi:MAG: polyprenyl synthetase family protein [Candidatus Omnitrophica bacterium]|nr:polyprenyl synthetase family protein [Candidatus Omnitrophota bacterium]
MQLQPYLHRRQQLINRAMDRALPSAQGQAAGIHRAMRYSVLGEGKRVRPILTLAACEAVGGRASSALHAACALEMIHAYSLVHDDLPAMDDDDFRRGKPSCHRKFGEALGILTGDALLTYAFELLTGKNGAKSETWHRSDQVHLRVIREVARAIGTEGMIGGQVADVRAADGGRATARQLESINARKTGALIGCSVRIGGLLGRATPAQYRALCAYGERIGRVFQLVDDLLDSDGLARRSGPDAVRRRAEKLTRSAVSALRPLGRRAEPLRELARFILRREA